MTEPLRPEQIEAAKAMDKELELLAADLEERRLDLHANLVREIEVELSRLRKEVAQYRAGQMVLVSEALPPPVGRLSCR
jgi:hypothetical protein